MKVFSLFDKKAPTKCIYFFLLGSYYNCLNVSIDKMNIFFYLRCSISLISYYFAETIQTSYSSCIFTIQRNTITTFVHKNQGKETHGFNRGRNCLPNSLRSFLQYFDLTEQIMQTTASSCLWCSTTTKVAHCTVPSPMLFLGLMKAALSTTHSDCLTTNRRAVGLKPHPLVPIDSKITQYQQ